MKKKNVELIEYWIKKTENYRKKYIFWCGLALALIIIIIIFLFINLCNQYSWCKFEPKKNIKIFKEECWNESYTNTLMAISEIGLSEIMLKSNITTCLKKEIVKPTEGFFEGITFHFCDYNISYEQKCEKKEVEEIEYIYYYISFCRNNRSRNGEYYYNSIPNKENLTWECGGKFGDLNILIGNEKTKITKEWLDENCECIEMNFRRLRFYEKPLNELFIKTAVANGCLTYKCFENYFVNGASEEKTWKEFVEELQEMFTIKKIIARSHEMF